MGGGEQKTTLVVLASLAALTSMLCLLYTLEAQAGLPMGHSSGVAQAQSEPPLHEWATTTVDDWGIVGWYTSLALEPVAPFYPHIAYYVSFPDYGLNYAALNEAGWATTTVDSQGIVGYEASLVLEPEPPYAARISYYDYTNGNLKYAWLSSAGWLSKTVDSGGNVGSYSSLALELTAPYTPHISYYDATNKVLKHAWLSGTGWLSEIVDGGGTMGWYTSLALAPTPPYTPHISYRDTTHHALKHAYWNGTRWITEVVDNVGSVGWYTSIALEPTSPYTPHISHFDRTHYTLKYASWDGTKWAGETVDNSGNVGWYSALALETTAPFTPHISYYDFANGALKHAWLGGTEWLSETVDSEENVGRYTSIDVVAAAASYTVCISYYDDTRDALKLACYAEAYMPRLTVTKQVGSDSVPVGALLTYILTTTNTGGADATGVVVTDALPANTQFYTATHGGHEEDGVIIWTGLTVTSGTSLPIAFAITVPCTVGLPITNELYRVVTSTQGISSAWGTPVTTAIVIPTFIVSFSPAFIYTCPNQPVTFTDTSATNGGPIVAWHWEFGDGGSATSRTASHRYATAGTYTVTLTVTDICGFSQAGTMAEAVRVGHCCVYLPTIMRDHSQ